MNGYWIILVYVISIARTQYPVVYIARFTSTQLVRTYLRSCISYDRLCYKNFSDIYWVTLNALRIVNRAPVRFFCTAINFGVYHSVLCMRPLCPLLFTYLFSILHIYCASRSAWTLTSLYDLLGARTLAIWSVVGRPVLLWALKGSGSRASSKTSARSLSVGGPLPRARCKQAGEQFGWLVSGRRQR